MKRGIGEGRVRDDGVVGARRANGRVRSSHARTRPTRVLGPFRRYEILGREARRSRAMGEVPCSRDRAACVPRHVRIHSSALARLLCSRRHVDHVPQFPARHRDEDAVRRGATRGCAESASCEIRLCVQGGPRRSSAHVP